MEVESNNTVEDENQPSVFSLCLRSKKRTLDLFLDNYLTSGASHTSDEDSLRIKLNAKINAEYGPVKDLPPPQPTGTKPASSAKPSKQETDNNNVKYTAPTSGLGAVLPQPKTGPSAERPPSTASTAIVLTNPNQNALIKKSQQEDMPLPPSQSRALAINNPYALEKPQWHPPWKLMRVISGHLGWVRTVAVDPSNEWFVTGSADRTIKIWDLASGTLKLTLTGHINTLRGLAISDKRPYLFSCAEDKKVICWDLEQNKAIRHYHGHLSGVYCMALHPTLDILVTGGRDSAVRVWDVRTQAPIFVLTGHTSTVGSLVCQGADPQIISGSHDSTVRCWDLAKGSCGTTLTHHKKSVRALGLHPKEFSMASGSPDNIKHWKFPEIKFVKNFSGHNAIVNTLAINQDNVMVSGADNGSMYFWDWRTGYNFQRIQTQVQPGSLDAEAGIFCTAFDQTGARLIVAEADKTIKIYKEDEEATEETHPVENWKQAVQASLSRK